MLSGDQLQVLRTCALLHDIGKPECWANKRPWRDHIQWTYKIVKECLGERYALISMRHHSGLSYPSEYHPQTEIEKIICLADNFSSGADRRERPEHGFRYPKLPIRLSHVLSDGSVIREKFDAAELAYVSSVLREKLKKVCVSFAEDPRKTYFKIFNVLENSDLRKIPADTRKPVNDVSLWDHLKLTAAFATCIWMDGYKGDDYRRYDFALLSGDADRISSYINVSRRLPDLNARSERIKKATKDVADCLADMLGPECVIYAAGGSFLALSPKSKADNVLGRVKEVFESTTQGQVTITVSHVIANGEEIRQNFGEVWRRAQRKMRVKKSERGVPIPDPVEEDKDVCDVCHSRPWVYEDKLKMLRFDATVRPERLCEVCWQLRREGKGVELNALKGETNFVALIKADGDNMGRVLGGDRLRELKKANTPSRLSALSDLINVTCEEKLGNVVEKYGGRCLYAGGDDVSAFVPGEKSLQAAKAIASTFRNEMAGQCTMSVGIAIFRYDLPVYVGLEASDYLLKRVKEEGKNGVAYAVIGGSGLTMSELKKTVKPRTWDEVDELLSIIRFMRESGVASSQIRKVAELSFRQPDKADVLIKYLMGRKVLRWEDGERFLDYLGKGLLFEAFLMYNLFKGTEL